MKCLLRYLLARARSRTTCSLYPAFITMPLAAASSECFIIFQLVPPLPPPRPNGRSSKRCLEVGRIVENHTVSRMVLSLIHTTNCILGRNILCRGFIWSWRKRIYHDTRHETLKSVARPKSRKRNSPTKQRTDATAPRVN